PASDLQIDFSRTDAPFAPDAPLAPPAPSAPRASFASPTLFGSDEPPVEVEERSGNGRFVAVLLVCGIAAAFALGYFVVMRSRATAPQPSAAATTTKPSVSETTVDVP